VSHTRRSRHTARERTWDEADLARLLATLTDTFLEFRRRDRLPEVLAEVAAGLLDVHGVAVSLAGLDGSFAVAAATDDEVARLEDLQLSDPDGGPVTAVASGAEATLLDTDASRHDRYATLFHAAVRAGIGYVYAVPVRRRGETFGSLTLYGERRDGLGPNEREIARALADIAATGLLQRRDVAAADLQVAQLEQALESRVVIEQAKGILLAQGKPDLDEAFLALRRCARNRHRRIEDVAREVVARAESATSAPVLPYQRTGEADEDATA
jgi:GAF domain-containing protein